MNYDGGRSSIQYIQIIFHDFFYTCTCEDYLILTAHIPHPSFVCRNYLDAVTLGSNALKVECCSSGFNSTVCNYAYTVLANKSLAKQTENYCK